MPFLMRESVSVAVCRILRVGYDSVVEGTNDFWDAVLHCGSNTEAELRLDLVKTDAVVARVFVLAADLAADQLHNLPFLIVLASVAKR